MAGESTVNQKGFSLIEVLVVSGLSTMLLLTVSALFMTFLTGSASTNISRTLNREGDSSINQLEHLIRNGLSVSCGTNTVAVQSEDNSTSVVSFNGNTLQIVATPQSGSPSTRRLTSSNVNASGTLECTAAGTKQYVDITLTLAKTDAPTQSETFYTSIQARN